MVGFSNCNPKFIFTFWNQRNILEITYLTHSIPKTDCSQEIQHFILLGFKDKNIQSVQEYQ